MSEDIQDKGPRKRLPYLSDIKSEYEKLCDELDGPADIGVKVKHHALAIYCREYRSDLIVPILLAYAKDEIAARRHWPWAAFAISQFVFETKEREKYTDEPSPQEIIELLDQIRQAAHDLGYGLAKLQTLSFRLSDPSAPDRRGHLAWLDTFFSQTIAGRISNELIEDADEWLAIDLNRTAFLMRLAEIEVAAKKALKKVDKTLLYRERSQKSPSLPNFVFRCSKIWRSLTGKKANASKVVNKSTDDLPPLSFFSES